MGQAIEWLKQKIKLLSKFLLLLLPVLCIIAISVLLAWLSTNIIQGDNAIILDKSIANFGAIGLPILFIWMQYQFKRIREQERLKRENAVRYQEQQIQKDKALKSIQSGESRLGYALTKIFDDIITEFSHFSDPEYQAKENGATDEEIAQAKERLKKSQEEHTTEHNKSD